MERPIPTKSHPTTPASTRELLAGFRVWNLVGSVAWQTILPFAAALVIGLFLDSKLRAGHTFTLILLVLSPVGAALLIRSTLKRVFAELPADKETK